MLLKFTPTDAHFAHNVRELYTAARSTDMRISVLFKDGSAVHTKNLHYARLTGTMRNWLEVDGWRHELADVAEIRYRIMGVK